MPKETYTVDPVRDVTPMSVNRLVTQLNQHLASIALLLARLEGRDGFSPTMKADLDLDGHRLLNVGSITSAKSRAVRTDRTVGGTTNETIPDPADTPANVDALRDDLVANTLPPITRNFDEHTDKINLIFDILRTAGLL